MPTHCGVPRSASCAKSGATTAKANLRYGCPCLLMIPRTPNLPDTVPDQLMTDHKNVREKKQCWTNDDNGNGDDDDDDDDRIVG